MNDDTNLFDENPILRFRHRHEPHRVTREVLPAAFRVPHITGLIERAGTAAVVTCIAVLRFAKINSAQCDPEIQQTQKFDQEYVGA